MAGEIKAKIIEVVNLIPKGYVSNYGTIATVVNILIGTSVSAQLVWWQLNSIWNDVCSRRRVVSKKWEISALKLWEKWQRQIMILKWEWVQVDIHNQINMKIYWYYFPEILS